MTKQQMINTVSEQIAQLMTIRSELEGYGQDHAKKKKPDLRIV